MYRLLPILGGTQTSGITLDRSYLESPWELLQCLKIIRSFRDYPDNWDGEGSVTFKEKTITNACNIVEFLSLQSIPSPDVSPNPHGTIALEWENDEGYAYVEIGTSQLTALIKTLDRRMVFALDRVDATEVQVLRSLAFQLRAVLYLNLTDFVSSVDNGELRHRWSQPLFDAHKITNQSLVASYEIAVAN